MNPLIRIALSALILLVSIGCGGGGGGGGGGGDDTGNADLSTDACGTLGLKIFSGSICTPETSSPVVAVEISTFDGRTELCSGTLISSQHVLTAGHCFAGQGSNVKSLRVEVGGTAIESTSFAIHPGYSERVDLAAIFNDVGIITLPASVAIAPLPLLQSRTTAAGDVIDIFGYGLTELGTVGNLESGQMQLSDVSATHLFAPFGRDGSNTCFGDSGGPALARNAAGQVGIVGTTSTGSPERVCRRGDVSLFINLQEPSVSAFIGSIVPDVGTI